MKLQKRVSKEKQEDQWVFYISHAEADAAFALMTPLERGMIAELQHAEQISTLLKVLTLWAARVEEAQLPLEKQDGIKHEG